MLTTTSFIQNDSDNLTNYQIIARIAARILLVSSLIVNTKATEDDFLIGASILSLFGGILLAKAAMVEANEQQIAPGKTTFANNLKLIATSVNVLMTLLLFTALLIEISTKQQPSIAGQSPIAGAAGAITI